MMRCCGCCAVSNPGVMLINNTAAARSFFRTVRLLKEDPERMDEVRGSQDCRAYSALLRCSVVADHVLMSSRLSSLPIVNQVELLLCHAFAAWAAFRYYAVLDTICRHSCKCPDAVRRPCSP